MLRRIALAFPLLLLAPVARAEEEPEQLLPAGTQVYLRWDGVEAHRASYEKTALGKMMQGDTGAFIAGTFTQLQDTLGSALTAQQLLAGTPPAKLQKLQADAAEAPRLLALLSKQGFVLGIEARTIEPPQVQATLIVPGAGANPGPLFGTLRLATALAQEEVKTKKVEGRSLQTVAFGPVQIGWWVEGKHAVVTAGTDAPEAVAKRMLDAKEPRLTGQPLYKKVQGFKQFETSARAFIDMAALAKLGRTRGKDMAQLLTDLGLDSLRSLTFYSGFDGAAERSLTVVDMPGPRKGLLRLAAGKPFTLADVPPIPEDAVSWSMTNFEVAALYDVALKATEQIAHMVAPDVAPQIPQYLKQVDGVLGVSLRNDLLGALDDKVVMYTSPADGPLTLGQSFLFKVKDEKKLQASLERAIKGLAEATGADVRVKKRLYHGVELREVQVKQPGFFFLPTYAVHDGWLVIGYYPQAVQGYVLRAKKELPSWKPGGAAAAAFEQLPREFTSVSVSDPRPGLKQLLAIAPLIGAAAQSAIKEFPFDVGALPNANEVTRHLFPNVSVSSDDGQALRLETLASLDLPVNLSGLDAYAVVLGFVLPRLQR
jgi:hypothetical protein